MRPFFTRFRRPGRLLVLPAVFVAGLMLGAGVTATAQQSEAVQGSMLDERVFGRAEAYLLALHNIVVSLSVDTERSAIGVARLEKRINKLERRLQAVEQRAQ